MDIHSKMVEKIIQEQEKIIGPVALEQAKKVPGLSVDWPKHIITFSGNKKEIIEKLVGQYKSLFGPASVETCKDAVKGMLSDVPKDQVPALLQ